MRCSFSGEGCGSCPCVHVYNRLSVGLMYGVLIIASAIMYEALTTIRCLLAFYPFVKLAFRSNLTYQEQAFAGLPFVTSDAMFYSLALCHRAG